MTTVTEVRTKRKGKAAPKTPRKKKPFRDTGMWLDVRAFHRLASRLVNMHKNSLNEYGNMRIKCEGVTLIYDPKARPEFANGNFGDLLEVANHMLGSACIRVVETQLEHKKRAARKAARK